MIELTTQQIADVTGGSLINGADPQAVVTGPVEFDSRKITSGAIFMALPGAKADGHDFVDSALRNGAALLVVGRGVEQPALLAEPVQIMSRPPMRPPSNSTQKATVPQCWQPSTSWLDTTPTFWPPKKEWSLWE